MESISPVGGYAGGLAPACLSLPATAQSTSSIAQRSTSQGSTGDAQAVEDSLALGDDLSLSASYLSINQSSELLLVSEESPAAAVSNELLGAVLLLLLLEYMRTENEDQKQGLLAMMGELLKMQQQGSQQSSTLLYASSSLSIESSELMVSVGGAANAYGTDGVSPSTQGVSASGLDVIA